MGKMKEVYIDRKNAVLMGDNKTIEEIDKAFEGECLTGMDIHSRPGDIIICVDRDNGGRGRSNPEELKNGKEYVIESITIHNWYTEVHVVGIEGACNSCAFKNKHSSTDNCYLVWEDGFLVCTYNHKLGEDCLMRHHNNIN